MTREIDPSRAHEVWAFNLCHEYSLRDSFPQYIPDSQLQRETKVQRILANLVGPESRYFCLAVFDEAEMIAALFQHRMEIDCQTACHIHGLWVHPSYRKQGLAKDLKLRGEAWALKTGCKFMDSNVRISNAPMATLNESLGYEVARLNYRKKLD